MSGHILHLAISHSHVFLLNSRLGHFSATSLLLEEATLLPKLQVYFAEFLSHESLEHLRILSSTTCVGLRYGQYNDMLSGFSRKSVYALYPFGRSLQVLFGFSIQNGFACPKYTYAIQRPLPSGRGAITTPSPHRFTR